MERLGFSNTWIEWIMECVSTVTYSYLINGDAKGQVIPSRGLRQGDPLSPYLFILCTEVLSGLCKQAQLDGSLPGVKVARQSPLVNHLLFADDTMFFMRSDQKSCNSLTKILQKYERASGQRINVDKSSITFSAKTSREMKTKVKRDLGIQKEGGNGKYLGLPENFGRRKSDVFESIVDKIRQRSHSWSSRTLSEAGKQVLLKSVLSSMPSYAMTCFKLPGSLCKRIQSVLTRFWWDDKPDKQKMSWVAWTKLTRPKNAGGLGFRDMERFNDALLAKIAWRLLKEPNTLLARVLLGKYCHSYSFMECSIPSNPSHGWRSIMAGRNVIKQGAGWLIGNGESVKIWRDPWLSTTTPLCPYGPIREHQEGETVSSLLDPSTNQWNWSKIREELPQYVDCIKQIPLAPSRREDQLVWLPVKSGQYTTRSGYGITSTFDIPDAALNFNWQSHLWKLHTSPKVKNFLWKAMSDALPVGEQLARRGLNAEVTCRSCGETESVSHLLLHCRRAKEVWLKAPILHLEISSTTTIEDFLSLAKHKCNLPPSGVSKGELYPWIRWQLSLARNSLVFEDKEIPVSDILIRAIKSAREWQEAQNMLTTPRLTTDQPEQPVQTSSCKVFVDAAWNSTTGNGGFGWAVVNADSAYEERFSDHKESIGSALIAEAWAVFLALKHSLLLNKTELQLFSDCQSLINEDGFHIELFGLLQDIRELRSSFDAISFTFIPRLANHVADSLAKEALASCDLLGLNSISI
ncbi:PREDICTED: uncharacterized protein LOC104743220 [Camelina sativa]|uniref:Uncharacterized protein LOC104743220 n=1 Tax=Camelina sativa TaxID=90675 RepID=A0ABM0VXP3_CAMSA|nr:PREDICTED: uncharacterized protein LOC104743220 [Camelina sativa]